MLTDLAIDLRHSLRRLTRAPVSTAIVIATLAVSIGANVTAFSLLNATYLRKVSSSDPDGLVAISVADTQSGRPGQIYSATFEAFRDQQQSLLALSMYSSGLYRMDARGTAVDVSGESVTPSYFDLLGARLAAGRALSDSSRGISPEAVISEGLWRRLFAADPNAVGETITIDSKPVTIVGVAAQGFFGLLLDTGTDFWLPVSFQRTPPNVPDAPLRTPYIVGRLRPGTTLEHARAEATARWPAIQAATSSSLPPAAQAAIPSQRVRVEPLANGFSTMRVQYGQSFALLVGLTAIPLAVGCVNLAGLMTARALSARHEVAIKLALGLSRARLLRQFLTDGLILALLGAGCAIPLAWWSTQTLTAMMSFARTLPLQRPMTPDLRVLGIAAVAASVAGLAIGLLPAWRVMRGGNRDAMAQGRTVAATLGRSGRVALVVQVALSMVLLVGAGLFAGMLSSLDANQARFRERNIIFARLSQTPGDRAVLESSYFRSLIGRLSAIPGVESVVLSTYFPAFLGFRGFLPADMFSANGAAESSTTATGLTELVSPGFFGAFRISQLRGRDFTWDDDEQAPAVVVVNESLAAKLFPDGGAVGRRVRRTAGAAATDLEVVGVVADAPIGSIREPHAPVAFRPMMQDLARAQTPLAHVRVVGDLAAVRDAYVGAVESEGRHFVRGLFTLDGWMDNALLQERIVAAVSTSAAALAVLLACLGIYGALAYMVTGRIREIGVRMALGASRGAVLRVIIKDGLLVVLAGVVIGIPCALGAAGLIRSQLYGVGPNDPRTLIICTALFLLAGAVAAWFPALRASRINPTDALRQT